MLRELLSRLDSALSKGSGDESDDSERDHAVRTATAALLIEVARSDADYDPEEFETLTRLIETRFELSAEEALALSETADRRVEESVSLHEFTSVLHRTLAVEEKSAIVALMWRMAYADGELDMHEDALVLKVADLLYVPRADVMRSKALAAEAQA